MNSLCNDFPREAGVAYLAYAEAGSFVQFLLEAYGQSAFQSLIDNYVQGVSCENGPLIDPYNKTLSDLYQDWRTHIFGEDLWKIASRGVLPWIILAGAVFAGPLMLLIGSAFGSQNRENNG